MLAHLAFAEGSPSATLVIDARASITDEQVIRNWLIPFYHSLQSQYDIAVLKYALIRPSTHPMFDLDYRFVQCIPSSPPEFDFKGSCGHSILCAVTVAGHWGWLSPLAPGLRVRVNVENNGDHVVCEVDEAQRRQVQYTAHFIEPYNTKLRSLLLTGEPVTQLSTPSGTFAVSLVSAGNPYVFVDATALKITSSQEVFTAGEDVWQVLQHIRQAAIQHLGWNPRSIFPKIAMVGAFDLGRLAVRAISVPTWHPTLAMTGAICLGAAATIQHSIPARLVEQSIAGHSAEQADINHHFQLQTPDGLVAVTCTTTGTGLDDTILYMSVSNKLARLLALAGEETLPRLQTEVVIAC